ncbi:hypothetical protein R1flu_017808 [Riccia fluitans]|uniref:Ribosome-recycling factor, chloroplastic n=1 Tax=Riccia fluitans TaxID=41844 RepID=A0ABD1ZE05_9MARC
MASRTFGRVAKSRCLIQSKALSVSSSIWQPRPDSLLVDGTIESRISKNISDQCTPRALCSTLFSCLRHAFSGGLAFPVPYGRTHGAGFPRIEGAPTLSRSFAAKAKKTKRFASEESEGVEEDVAAVAKETATKLMDMALDVLSREHSKLRTGRASSGMLDHITVDSHGVRTPLNHIAAVSVTGLQTLSVLPYDPSMVKEVEKSLLVSPLGLNPIVEGSILTVPLPRLTKDVCESMCKLAVKAGETAKMSIRRARKDALDRVKAAGLSKDETKRVEKDVEELTKKYVKAAEELCKKKEKEIMA